MIIVGVMEVVIDLEIVPRYVSTVACQRSRTSFEKRHIMHHLRNDTFDVGLNAENANVQERSDSHKVYTEIGGLGLANLADDL